MVFFTFFENRISPQKINKGMFLRPEYVPHMVHLLTSSKKNPIEKVEKKVDIFCFIMQYCNSITFKQEVKNDTDNPD